jgi:NAD(P)-dependent dehydrogenase (short-subunit alcohol dehydrogenase family)
MSNLLCEGRACIVTGAGRGIGREYALRLAAYGASVIVNDLGGARDGTGGDVGPAQEVVDDIVARGGKAVANTDDVSSWDGAQGLTRQAVETFGRLDVLVNNAGGSPPADTATASPRFTAGIIALNLTAPIVCAQRANAVMQEQDSGGVIVNIASVSGVRASPETLAYGAAKAGLLNATKTMAVEFAPKVRVNAVVVGLVVTEQAHLFYGDDAGIASVGATVPLGRMADPSDVGDVCLFLASPLARYVTGAEVLVHGGGERPAYRDAAKGTSR